VVKWAQILLNTNFSGNPIDADISLYYPTHTPVTDKEANPDDANIFDQNIHDFAVSIHENQADTVFGEDDHGDEFKQNFQVNDANNSFANQGAAYDYNNNDTN